MNIPRVCRILSIAALGLLLAAVSTSAQPADVTSHNPANFAIPRVTFGSEFANTIPGAVSTSAQPADVTTRNVAIFAIPRVTFGNEFANRPIAPSIAPRVASPMLGLGNTSRIEFTTADNSQDGQQPQADTAKTQKSWPARHPILTGTLIGATVGAAVGALGEESEWPGRGGDVLACAGLFAGIGALIGLAF